MSSPSAPTSVRQPSTRGAGSASSASGATEAKGELCVFVACHGFQVSVPVRRVERLILYEDVAEPLGHTVRSGKGLVPLTQPSSDGTAVIQVGAQAYARWDLGALLELPHLKHAWILMRVPVQGYEVPVALATGACRIVQPLSQTAPLPPGMFRARRSALWAAFEAPKRLEDDGRVGLCLDPLRLWTSEELSRSQDALRAVRAAGGSGR